MLGGGNKSGGYFFFRFRKGGSKKNKAGMRGVRNFKGEMRVILGAKIPKNLRSVQFCATFSYFQFEPKHNQRTKLLEML